MTQRAKAYRNVLLGFFLTISHVYGEEARGSGVEEGRASLATSISRREFELAMRDRKDVLVDVRKRIQDLGLTASASQLNSLLEQRAHLEIAIDKCRLAGDSCWADEAAMADVEASFRQKAGISTREFRSGRRNSPFLDAERTRAAGPITAMSANDTCTCNFAVYSLDRWMNGHWGLECNNHASHGVCSNNVDSGHTPGIGAMTGDIDLYFGGSHVHRDCPDDQYTCFKGPSTDHVGSWGNACSCDTWHSQYYNPSTSWYGGGLTESTVVYQLGTSNLTVAGACNEVSVSVKEFIQENDPWCCDDPMGDLWVNFPLADGYSVTDRGASAQNCNGGSQSGVSPNCGTFGATIRLVSNCSTYSPPICDPQLEANCWDSGGIWKPAFCACAPGCEPMMFNGVMMPLPPPC
ncbi:MAG TPA: hypothetical protein VN493_02285 [Thermoanaerobaculia bacterium]|nr:hypothetical protein [Thermoanaerobaculia bacterium]